MRYEAKHSYFKGLANTIGNFINIPFSLAMRHQLLQCYWNTTSNDFLGMDMEVGPGMNKLRYLILLRTCMNAFFFLISVIFIHVYITRNPNIILLSYIGSVVAPNLLHYTGETVSSAFEYVGSKNYTCILQSCIVYTYRSKWIKVDGTIYKQSTGIVLRMEDDLPQIGEILNIYTVNGATVIFRVVPFSTSYNSHYRAYILNQATEEQFYSLSDLAIHTPVHIRSSRTLHQKFILLPYYVQSM